MISVARKALAGSSKTHLACEYKVTRRAIYRVVERVTRAIFAVTSDPSAVSVPLLPQDIKILNMLQSFYHVDVILTEAESNHSFRSLLSEFPQFTVFIDRISHGVTVQQVLSEFGITGYSDAALAKISTFFLNLITTGEYDPRVSQYKLFRNLALARLAHQEADWFGNNPARFLMEDILDLLNCVLTAVIEGNGTLWNLKTFYEAIPRVHLYQAISRRDTTFPPGSAENPRHCYDIEIRKYYEYYKAVEQIPPPIREFLFYAIANQTQDQISRRIVDFSAYSASTRRSFVSSFLIHLELIALGNYGPMRYGTPFTQFLPSVNRRRDASRLISEFSQLVTAHNAGTI